MDRATSGSHLDRSFQRPHTSSHRFLRRRAVLRAPQGKQEAQSTSQLNESLQSLFDTAEEMHFDPATFKTQKCPLEACLPDICPNYHSERDRRRNVNVCHYDCVPCKWVKPAEVWKPVSECRFKDECRFAHSVYEVRYHPKVYKTKNCENSHCALGIMCWGKHDTLASPPPPVAANATEEVSPLAPLFDLIAEKEQKSLKLTSELTVLNARLQRTESELEVTRHLTSCSHCHSRPMRLALVPCGHVQCGECCEREKCQVCGAGVVAKLELKLGQ